MSKPRTYQTEAIIIRKTKLKEADRILTLLTMDYGKIRVVAKGVRHLKSRMAGHLELLTHSQINLARGRNLDTIIGAQTISSFLPLKCDLELSAYGLYMLELTDQFTPEEQENKAGFELLRDSLHVLCSARDRDLLLHYFEVHLLQASGYRPQLHQCVSCLAPLAPVTNYFSAHAGGMLCPACREKQTVAYPVSTDTLRVLQLLQDNIYETVCGLKLSRSLNYYIQGVMRDYISFILERELRSVDWLRTLKREPYPVSNPAEAKVE